MISDYLYLIGWPLLAAITLTTMHVYFGLHVVKRGVIFVDLALAQVAALGTTVGIILGWEGDSFPTYLTALGFTFLGAILFSYMRPKNKQIPQESLIGITYIVCAALMILLFSHSAEGAEHLNHLLVGSILFVTPEQVLATAILYLIIGYIQWKFRAQFLRASDPSLRDEKETRLWDFLFYMTFGFMVTNSVKIAGVLLVFSFLIIPTVAALFYMDNVKKRLYFGWAFGVLGSFLGMAFSLLYDIPTGASIVVTFGVLLILAWVGSLWIKPTHS
ncbi:MAG: metal ABC transporter permease [Fidelibacterota bacterium]